MLFRTKYYLPKLTMTTLYPLAQSRTPSDYPSCSYCQQAHSSNSCQVISHPHARKQALQKAGRCFVCLRKGHISRVSQPCQVSEVWRQAPHQHLLTERSPSQRCFVNRVPRLPCRERNHPRRNPHSMQMRLPSHLVKVAQPHRCGLAQIVQYFCRLPKHKPSTPMFHREDDKFELFSTVGANVHM